MHKHYPHHPLGNFIRAVDERNRSGTVSRLLGVSVNKSFIPSVANTIGTDMTNYKVVRKGQFACNLIHVGRDEVIPISLYDKEEDALLSSAYDVFEIIDESVLLPEYLRLCAMRPEFDCYAMFQAVYGIRGNLPWEDFCAIEIPVPTLAEQERIVSQFATIEERIRQCHERITLLERTATALYRKTFVEGIDRNHLPEGWRMGTLGEVTAIKAGGDMPKDRSDIQTAEYSYPIIANGLEDKGVVGFAKTFAINEPSVTISARGTIGYSFVRYSPYYPIVRLISVIPHNSDLLHYLWYQITAMDLSGSGSVQSQLTIPAIMKEDIILPPLDLLVTFEKRVGIISHTLQNIERQLSSLEKLKAVILTQIK